MCKINPRNNFAFVKLFGSEENKDLLIHLINSIVDQNDQVEELTLNNPYNLADYKGGKMSILDIKATGFNKKIYNIEMQVAEDMFFDRRAIYYWSKLVSSQLSEGKIYKELNKTISINILDFDYVKNNENFHNKYRILNADTKMDDNLHNLFELHYIELRKFKKEFTQIATVLDRWVTFLNQSYKLDNKNLPKEIADDRIILKAIDSVDRMFNEEEREIYEQTAISLMNQESVIYSALEKGRMIGEKDGEKRGIKKGMEKGMEKGKLEGKLDVAKNLLDVLDDETISQKTGLDIADIAKLRAR
jgi:predicted transposase/invertase (TIGR01784 family)